ncbi:hypothetical protein [Saccharothrix yanglingensis]|uniref:Secreted protein n=1 Tax=Saccharothrix yanglingensis TaxID=659496 RepID=A0ABU0X7T6_9PSEU|nr:hypothetical protein [Saccharothrix yanglingensis]MDQ2588193.1 hypothetical protein [Saccharothrix yanglingensis]
MRVLWATCGLAVAASALTGVLIGLYIDASAGGADADIPSSTWITGRPSTTTSSTPSAVTTDAVTAPSSSTTTTTVRTTTTTTPTPVAPPPPPVETTEAPPPVTTTTKTRSTEWPCSPLNPLPPPSCRD